MLQLPRRTSLISQTADALRKAIEDGFWHEHLPGERELADRFQISRPTLREALKLLQRQGIIDVAHGKRRTIRPAHRSSATPGLTVAAISQDPPHQMSSLAIFYMNELRKHTQKAGLELTVLADRHLRGPHPEKLLETYARNENISCWLLVSVTEKTQRWFDERQLPALVAGSCYANVNLPSLDIDYGAVCRHAAGVFLREGHRHLGFLTQAAKVAGDEASEAGFQSAVADSAHDEAKAFFFRHDGTREDICRKLNRLLRSPARPTALLVSRPSHLLTALSYLQHSGVHVPRDLSLISRDNDPYLNHLVPDLTRYTFRRRHFADRLARLVVQLATTGSIPRRQHRLIPKFHPGATVAPVRG